MLLYLNWCVVPNVKQENNAIQALCCISPIGHPAPSASAVKNPYRLTSIVPIPFHSLIWVHRHAKLSLMWGKMVGPLTEKSNRLADIRKYLKCFTSSVSIGCWTISHYRGGYVDMCKGIKHKVKYKSDVVSFGACMTGFYFRRTETAAIQ